MTMRLKTLLSITLVFVSAAAAQDPKTFYEQLPTAQPTPALFQEMVSVSKQLATLPKSQVQDLIPLVFAAIKSDTDGMRNSAMGLHAISRRPDSSEVLKPYLKDIAGLLTSPNPAYKAMAGVVLLNMNPQPPEAADILLGFINGPTGAINEKIDALTALTRLQKPLKERVEVAAIQILKQPMAPSTLGAAINASIYPGAPDAMVDAIAEHLNHADWQVRMRSIFALRAFGPGAVGRYRGQLTKMANDPKQPDAVKQFAQNTLDGKDEKCLILQSNPPQFIPAPGCKAN